MSYRTVFRCGIYTRIPMWERVARRVAGEWNTRGNCMLVAGATYPAELKRIREVIGDMPILSPAWGAQGADTKEAVRAGVNRYGSGLLISVSRGIYTDDPASSARLLRDTYDFDRLCKQHEQLEQEIETLTAGRGNSSKEELKIQTLKKEKLAVKERILLMLDANG
ncbi:hypothetical protein CHS0354_018416 [Potamilus streckersoni]|uniref:Orotidine 5'-phosphate decarboxylase n=1 Tax=Potamilus streckersoni TaxID=2493646 RepID=A0AAE0TAD3_9BIVA|nr:hypothetical protein CHS0354_018416 [Potamilus streckersoni]